MGAIFSETEICFESEGVSNTVVLLSISRLCYSEMKKSTVSARQSAFSLRPGVVAGLVAEAGAPVPRVGGSASPRAP